MRIKPGLQCSARAHVCGRQKRGSAIERFRKVAPQFRRERRHRTERYSRIAEAVIEGFRLQRARGRFVSEDDVQTMCLQMIHQRPNFAFPTYDVRRLVEMESSAQDLPGDQLRKSIR